MGDEIPAGRRKRVENSCECCHRRKVRCDVNAHGPPCTNCRLDTRQCVLRVPLKRGRKSRTQRKEALATPTPGAIEPVSDVHVGVPAQENATIECPTATLDIPRTILPAAVPECYADQSEPAQVYVPFYYFNYLEVPDMRHLAPTDIRNLERQNCLQVPSGAVLDEFVRQYFLYVHPCLPMLNEGIFWSMYSKRPHAGPEALSCSLAVFQAMLFASSRFVPNSILETCGFDNSKHARMELSRRTELLLEHEVERNSVALAQAALLLSLQSTVADQRLNSVWLSKAITHAEVAGAGHYFREKDKTRRLQLKRLWWSCILRDRMISLGVRRMVQIGPEKFDFDQTGLEEEDLAEECDKSDVYDVESKKTLSKIVVAQCELAIAMTPMMITAYCEESTSQSDEQSTAMLIHSMTAIERASTELTVWARRFKASLTHFANEGQYEPGSNPSFTLFAHQTMIHYYMIYQPLIYRSLFANKESSAQIALCNYQVSTLQRHQTQLDDYERRITRLSSDLQTCIEKVTDMIKDLSDKGLVHHLPISAPACAALPFILEIINHRLSPSTEKQAHQQQIDYYNRTMTLFRSQHDYTECVTAAVDTVLHVAEPEINSLAVTSPSQALTCPSGWSGIFIKDPLFYMRLSLSLDAALSHGKTPLFTDLPVWAMRSSLDSLLPTLPMSLDFLSPWLQQSSSYDADELRFIEVNEGDEVANADQWLNEDVTDYGFVLPQCKSWS